MGIFEGHTIAYLAFAKVEKCRDIGDMIPTR